MATYIKIASSTVGAGGATSVTFSSIPSTYTDLKLVSSARSTSSGDFILGQLNSITTSYSSVVLEGTGSGTGSYSYTDTGLQIGQTVGSTATANTFANNECYISNYASANYKSASTDTVTEDNAASGTRQKIIANLWSNTAAISSIQIVQKAGQTFAQYSTFTLYGVSNA
jgi:hypothetical protein